MKIIFFAGWKSWDRHHRSCWGCDSQCWGCSRAWPPCLDCGGNIALELGQFAQNLNKPWTELNNVYNLQYRSKIGGTSQYEWRHHFGRRRCNSQCRGCSCACLDFGCNYSQWIWTNFALKLMNCFRQEFKCNGWQVASGTERKGKEMTSNNTFCLEFLLRYPCFQ